jgi:hypothetical protein
MYKLFPEKRGVSPVFIYFFKKISFFLQFYSFISFYRPHFDYNWMNWFNFFPAWKWGGTALAGRIS